MIKTLLNHAIFEKCINIIFDGIINTFSNPNISVNNVRIEELEDALWTSHCNNKNAKTIWNINTVMSKHNRRKVDYNPATGEIK